MTADGARISRFGEYRGYSSPEFDGWRRFSQHVTVRDGTRIAVDYYRPTRAGELHHGAAAGGVELQPLPALEPHRRRALHHLPPAPTATERDAARLRARERRRARLRRVLRFQARVVSSRGGGGRLRLDRVVRGAALVQRPHRHGAPLLPRHHPVLQRLAVAAPPRLHLSRRRVHRRVRLHLPGRDLSRLAGLLLGGLRGGGGPQRRPAPGLAGGRGAPRDGSRHSRPLRPRRVRGCGPLRRRPRRPRGAGRRRSRRQAARGSHRRAPGQHERACHRVSAALPRQRRRAHRGALPRAAQPLDPPCRHRAIRSARLSPRRVVRRLHPRHHAVVSQLSEPAEADHGALVPRRARGRGHAGGVPALVRPLVEGGRQRGAGGAGAPLLDPERAGRRGVARHRCVAAPERAAHRVPLSCRSLRQRRLRQRRAARGRRAGGRRQRRVPCRLHRVFGHRQPLDLDRGRRHGHRGAQAARRVSLSRHARERRQGAHLHHRRRSTARSR